MSGLRCLTLSRSSDPGPPTLEELLRGNSERGMLYHAVLKKLRENTAFSSGNHQSRAPTEVQDWRPEPYSRAIMKTPQHTPLSTPGPSSRYNHPYSRAGSSAAVRPDVGPYASVSSSPARPTRAALQNKTGARQRGADYTSAARAPTPFPPLDRTTPTETPTGPSVKARAPPVTNKSGSSMKQSQLTVADDGALKLKQSSSSSLSLSSSSSLKPCHDQKVHPTPSNSQCPQTGTPDSACPPSAPPTLPTTLPALKDVSKISTNALCELGDQLQSAQEVGLTLLFSDGSSQLRPGRSSRLGSGGETEVEGVCLALPAPNHTRAQQTTAGVTVEFFLLPLDLHRERVNEWTREHLLKLLQSRTTQKICFGAQELMCTLIEHFSLSAPEFVGWYVFDPAIAGWLLDSECPVRSFADLLGAHGMALDTGSGSAHNLVCRDLLQLGPATLKLYKKMQEHGLWRLFSCVEMPLVPLLAGMEAVGISVDTGVLLQYSNVVGRRIREVEEAAHKAAGHHFLLTSAQQLRKVLYEELHLDQRCTKPLMRTAVLRHKSTSEAVLQQLKDFHPLPSLVLQHRQLLKLKSTYIDGVVPFVHNGVLKPRWLHMGTATGRLASSSPNIQAFPKQQLDLASIQQPSTSSEVLTAAHINIREAVHSREGFTFISADFKSIELRLLAHLSNDADLLRVLSASPHSDIFKQLTAEWLAKEEAAVTSAERERTKRVVYAIVYGAGRERLAEILDMSSAAVKDVMDGFLSKFSGVEKFIQSTLTHCRANGYVTSLLGRKRFLPFISSQNYQERSHCERQAVNFVVQGSAADLCKCCMVGLSSMISRESPTAKLVVQIHDELLLEAPDEVAEQVAGKMQAELESCSLLQSLSQPLKVPIQVKVSVGKSWNVLQSLDKLMT